MLLLTICVDAEDKKTSLVDPFIGTSGEGAVHPGAVMPNGLMSVSPFNVMGSDLNKFDKDKRWWSAPYNGDNKILTGFSHLNLSGAECPEAGALLTMATGGPLEPDYHIWGTPYSDEHAVPGYYSVKLDNYGIKAEVSATMRTSIERYTFPGGQGNIIIHLGEGLTNESGAFVRQVSSTEIEGMKLLGKYCYADDSSYPLYFAMRINKVPKKTGAWKKQPYENGIEAAWLQDNGKYKIYRDNVHELGGDQIGWYWSFDTEEDEIVYVQMGISLVSCANAWGNLADEQDGFNFNEVRKKADEAWESTLNRIEVQGGTMDLMRIFYTALYHANLQPVIINDVNGQYPAMGSGKIRNIKDIKPYKETITTKDTSYVKIHKASARYSLFQLSETSKDLHQLMSLVYPEKQEEMVRSMIAMYQENGWMPKNEIFSTETAYGPGDPAIPVITDTYLKGIRGFDIHEAYEAFIKSADTFAKSSNPLRPDINFYLNKGFYSIDSTSCEMAEDISVSNALECYIADNALALLSDELGKQNAAERFRKRSSNYKDYFCKETESFRPRTADGEFLEPFRAELGRDFMPAPGFHEGSAIAWSFNVPWDVEGLANLYGGKKKLVDKLWNCFQHNLVSAVRGPGRLYPFIFSRFRGEEWRTHELMYHAIRHICTDKADGLPENDNFGALSSWIVFAMLGINPDCPGVPEYTFSAPSFSKITIHLNPEYSKGCKELRIKRSFGKYVRQVKSKTLFLGSRISHDNLITAGTLDFKCSPER